MSDDLKATAEQMLSAIPFLPPQRGNKLDLLMAVEVTGNFSSPETLFVPAHAGLGENFFQGHEDETALKEIMTSVDTDPVGDYAPRTFRANSEMNFSLAASLMQEANGGPGVELDAGNARNCSFTLGLTDVETKSLLGNKKVTEFLRGHVIEAVESLPMLEGRINQTPTWNSGNVEMVVGFVILSQKGRSQLTCKKKAEASGGFSLTGISNAIAGIAAKFKSSKEEEAGGTGTLGAIFQIFHMVKSYRKPKLRIKESFAVQRMTDPQLQVLMSDSNLRKVRDIVGNLRGAGKQPAFGIVNENRKGNASAPSDYQSVIRNDHATMEAAVYGRALLIGHLKLEDDDEASAELEVMPIGEAGEPIYGDSRVDGDIMHGNFYRGSWKWLVHSSVSKLSDVYQKLVSGQTVTLFGATVVSMKPAFRFDASGLLPIHYDPMPSEDSSKIPGMVHRVEKMISILCPVEGYGQNKYAVSLKDADWRVKESLVYVDATDEAEKKKFIDYGFYELKPSEADPEELDDFEEGSFVVMGKQELVKLGAPETIFRPTKESE